MMDSIGALLAWILCYLSGKKSWGTPQTESTVDPSPFEGAWNLGHLDCSLQDPQVATLVNTVVISGKANGTPLLLLAGSLRQKWSLSEFSSTVSTGISSVQHHILQPSPLTLYMGLTHTLGFLSLSFSLPHTVLLGLVVPQCLSLFRVGS